MSVNLLVGMTGSIGVLNMPMYLYVLRTRFPSLKIIMTRSAEYFISRESMALMADQIYTTQFPLPTKREDSHIPLAKWADIFIVLPATAHILAQAAQGMADTLLSTTILSYEKPILFFPNMNLALWSNAATQRNVNLLKEYGHVVCRGDHQHGYAYATGEKGVGCSMPLPGNVIQILEAEIKKRFPEKNQNSDATSACPAAATA